AGAWRMSKIPQWEPGADDTGNWGGSATSVDVGSAHPTEAVRYAAWMNTSADGVHALVEHSGGIPADLANAAEARETPPEFFSHQSDFYEHSTDNADGVQPFTFGPNVNVAYSLFNDAFGVATRAATAAAFGDAVPTVHEGTVADLENQGYDLA